MPEKVGFLTDPPCEKKKKKNSKERPKPGPSLLYPGSISLSLGPPHSLNHCLTGLLGRASFATQRLLKTLELNA